MKIAESRVLETLALALPNDIPDHRLEYLLKKMYGFDALTLDSENTELMKRIGKIAEEINRRNR